VAGVERRLPARQGGSDDLLAGLEPALAMDDADSFEQPAAK
jgi:hypothetical protein